MKPKRHRWRERYFNPFGRDYPMVCIDCGMEAKKSQVKRGGLGPCRPPLLLLFEKAEHFVRQHGFGWEVDWCDRRIPFDMTDAQRFLHEYAWVVFNCGMSNRIIRAKWQQLRTAFHYFDPSRIVKDLKAVRRHVLTIFAHKGKVDAVLSTAKRIVTEGFYTTIHPSVQRDPLKFLATFPFIGEVTKYHLARNLGFEYVKPDLHLTRLASRFKLSPIDMCLRIHRMTGRRLGTIDVILWRFCVEGGRP